MSRELADHLKYFSEIGVDRRQPRSAVAQSRRWLPGSSPSMLATATRQSASGSRRTDAETLDDIHTEIGPACMRCKLCALGRTQIVFGVGHPKARLMFVGEAPGEEEDKRGEPFVGRAGQLLTKIIEAIGLSREQVYIANVIKCRPPANRNPEPDEVATCEPFLFRQIDVIQPTGDRAARQVRGAVAAEDDGSDHQAARPAVRLSRRHADSDLPSRPTCCAIRRPSAKCGKT